MRTTSTRTVARKWLLSCLCLPQGEQIFPYWDEICHVLMPRRSPVHIKPAETVSQLLYVSRKTPALACTEFPALVEQAAQRNVQNRITGTVLAGGGLYLGFLEGPAAAVNHLWSRLVRDRRHAKPTVLMANSKGVGRLFPAYALAMQTQATPLQMMSLSQDVRRHVNEHAHWSLTASELAVLVDRSARRRQTAQTRSAG